MESERSGLLVEAAASAFACLDSAAAVLEDLGVELRHQWRYLKTSPNGPLRPLVHFLGGINLTQPWVFTLMLFHVGLFVASVKSRDDSLVQIAIFTFGLVGLYIAEKLNTFFGRHWWRLSRTPYFDPDGAFLCSVWSGPLLLVGSVIVGNTLYTLSQQVLKWKRAERRIQSNVLN